MKENFEQLLLCILSFLLKESMVVCVCVQMMTSLLCWSDSRCNDSLPLRSDWTLYLVDAVFDILLKEVVVKS